jgi:ABC-type transporter Mla subunit MlaD
VAAALVQEMQNLEKALEDTSALVTSSTIKLEQIEKQAAALLLSGTNAVDHHEEDLSALGKQVHTVADQLKTEIDHGAQLVVAEAADVTSIAEKAYAAVDAAKTNVGHLADGATQHAQELTAAIQHFGELIKQVEGSLNARIGVMQQNVEHGVAEITGLEHAWTQLGETTAQSLADALHQTSDEIDQKFIAPLEEGVKHFQDLTKQIEEDVLAHPVTALGDQLKNSILTEAQHEIDELSQQLQKLLDGAVHALSEAGGGNDAVTKEIQAVFHELEPVWNQLTDALRSVQSIWDTVKSAASIL